LFIWLGKTLGVKLIAVVGDTFVLGGILVATVATGVVPLVLLVAVGTVGCGDGDRPVVGLPDEGALADVAVVNIASSLTQDADEMDNEVYIMSLEVHSLV
jgi:hypothetical protein